MADLTMDRRPGVALDRDIAIAVSVVAHVLVFVALFWRFGAAPTYPELPAMSVQLAPWPQTARQPEPPKPLKTQRVVAAAAPEAPAATLPPVLSRPAASAQERSAALQAPDGEASGVRKALRGMTGCNHADLLGLSPSARQACLDRLAKAPGGQFRLNLDKRGEYAAAKNQEPYLARKPKNGCKIGAGGDVAPSGAQGVAGGVGCAWSF